MALFDRLKQILIPEEKQKKKNDLEGLNEVGIQDVSPDEGKEITATQSDRQVRIAHLTPRENDLYLQLLEGFTLKESAKKLGVKYSTANTHMTGIYKKLGVKSRAELIINYRDVNGGNTQSP